MYMGKLVTIFSLLLIIIRICYCSTIKSGGIIILLMILIQISYSQVVINQSNNSLHFQMEDLQVSKVNISNSLYHEYSFTGCGFLMVEGEAKLPIISILLELESSLEKINLLNTDSKYIIKSSVKIKPNEKRILPENNSTDGLKLVFYEKDDYYSQNTFFPAKLYDIEYLSIGVNHYARITIYPIHYNPTVYQVKIYSDLKFDIIRISPRLKLSAQSL